MKGSFHTIPARIVSVTSVRDTGRNVIGWQSRCFNCKAVQSFHFLEHANAIQFRLDHVCYNGSAKKKSEPIRRTNLHSGKTGTLGR